MQKCECRIPSSSTVGIRSLDFGELDSRNLSFGICIVRQSKLVIRHSNGAFNQKSCGISAL